MKLAKWSTFVARPTSIKWLALWLLSPWLVAGLASPAWSIDPVQVEFLWLSQPELDFDWRPKPSLPNVEVTVEHLNAIPARERMQAAQSILRVPDSPLQDRSTLLKALLARLAAGESHRLVRIEMIAAACELDDGQAAEMLWKLAQGDLDAESIVQDACVRWRSAVPIERWRQNLANRATTDQDLLQAVDGLGAAGTNADVPLLEGVVLDGTRSAPLRLRSSRAIGRIAEADQVPLAEKLRDSTADNAQLLAVEVLARSPVASVTEFVQQIALKGPGLAQRAAYRWLCQRDTPTAQRLVGDFLKHPDSEVRLLALNQITLADTEQTLPSHFAAFTDVHPDVRTAAREHVLVCCGRSEERLQTTLEILKQTMASSDWRVLEQSMRLTVELKQPEYCDRLMSLITHDRPEVCITACWALRHLAEKEDVLVRMLDHVKVVTEKLLDQTSAEITEVDLQCTAHLFEAFGHRKFEPAKETALQYVPKNTRLGLITRMTAIWTCGRLWENGENKELINELHARIADKGSMFPEPMSLRFAATLALGWIADKESREPLITWDEPKPNPIGYATQWALQRIDSRK